MCSFAQHTYTFYVRLYILHTTPPMPTKKKLETRIFLVQFDLKYVNENQGIGGTVEQIPDAKIESHYLDDELCSSVQTRNTILIYEKNIATTIT
ncbi:hypothetical protein BLOT_013797 [Blomia tropicalis]|nr:hypothetical protein BLOT_013797 [Blomia tropicalis]